MSNDRQRCGNANTCRKKMIVGSSGSEQEIKRRNDYQAGRIHVEEGEDRYQCKSLSDSEGDREIVCLDRKHSSRRVLSFFVKRNNTRASFSSF